MFLEEDITRNAEFPHDGKFQLSSGSKYKVCGEQADDDATPVPTATALVGNQTPLPRPQYYSASSTLPGPSRAGGWNIPRPWASDASFHANSKGKQKATGPPYEPLLKRSFLWVTLSLDNAGKKIIVESTTRNVYVTVAESAVCVPAILAEVGRKVSMDPTQLLILDNKFLPVTDDKGTCIMSLTLLCLRL